MATKQEIKKLQNAAAVFSNPLRCLTQTQIERLLEMYRRGQDVKLQMMFAEIEKTMPLFGVCINKRTAGILNRQWKILPVNENDARSRAQAESVQKMFEESDSFNFGSLTKAIEALALAPFRGRACVKPWIDDSGCMRFKTIDNWYTLQNRDKLYWNPTMDQGMQFTDQSFERLQELSEDEVAWIAYDRPIDIPGFVVYLRQLVGETKWSEFVERQGIPQVLLTAPDGTSDANLDEFNARAAQIWLGGSGTLPSGTQVNQLTEARGQDPFSSFCDHQMKMVCLLAVGSSASVLGDVAGGLNEGVSKLQKTQFDSFVSQDCKMIANALTRCAVKMCVKKLYGENAELLCRFTYVEDEDITANEYLDMLQKLNTAGIPVDIEEFKRVSKISFIAEGTKDLWTPKSEQ